MAALFVGGCGGGATGTTAAPAGTPVSSAGLATSDGGDVVGNGTDHSTTSSSPAAVSPVAVTRIVTLHTADGERTARVHHPTSAAPGAALVVMLHPAATSASDAESYYGWDSVADRDGFVVAYPDGRLDSLQNTWNAGSCCPPASQLGTDDVGFLDDLSAALRVTDGLGDDVYAVGFSNGAMLAYAWACASPGRLVGIGVVAGALTSSCDRPAATTVVAVHGNADKSVPVDGGQAPDGTTFPSVADSMAPFLAADECQTPPAEVQESDATVTVWSCPDGRRLVRALMTHGDHAWPGAGPSAGRSTQPTDATGFLWSQLQAG